MTYGYAGAGIGKKRRGSNNRVQQESLDWLVSLCWSGPEVPLSQMMTSKETVCCSHLKISGCKFLGATLSLSAPLLCFLLSKKKSFFSLLSPLSSSFAHHLLLFPCITLSAYLSLWFQLIGFASAISPSAPTPNPNPSPSDTQSHI